MTGSYALLTAALVFFATFGVCADGAPPAVPPRVVIVFGDSITAGNMLPKQERPHLWVDLAQQQSSGRLKMVNEGKGGRPTDSLKDFEALLTRQPKADLLVLALGTNDSRDTSDQCVPKAAEHLRAIITRARQAWGAKLPILIVGPPNINKDALGPTKRIASQRDAKLKELGTAYAALAKELHSDFISLYGVIPASSLSRDGVHPDAAGNEAIAKAMLPKLLAAGHP